MVGADHPALRHRPPRLRRAWHPVPRQLRRKTEQRHRMSETNKETKHAGQIAACPSQPLLCAIPSCTVLLHGHRSRPPNLFVYVVVYVGMDATKAESLGRWGVDGWSEVGRETRNLEPADLAAR